MGIKKQIKTNIIKLVPNTIKWEIERSSKFLINKNNEAAKFLNISFSQEGEDLILHRLFNHKSDGFYIDIGAHHPYRFSNTYKFYLLGWSGINIDPLPGTMQLFREKRPMDINLEIAISADDSKEIIYYMFDEPALNTFDVNSAAKIYETISQIKKKINIKPRKLADVLNEHLPKGQALDFISVDVEGMDLEVLQSNDWNKYRPAYIVVENRETNLLNDFKSELNKFLYSKNYELVAKAVNSLIFKSI